MESADEFGPVIHVCVSVIRSLPCLTATAHGFAETQCTMHWCSSLSDNRAGGPGTGLLPHAPDWPRLPGLLLGGGKQKHFVLLYSVLLSWTVNATKVSHFLLQYFKAYCFWHCLLIWVEVANFIFYCDVGLRLVVEVLWQMRVTEAQMGTSAATLALCKCQCWHAWNTEEAPRCVLAFGLFSQRLWCLYNCSLSALLTLLNLPIWKLKKSPPESPSGNVVTHELNR